MATSREQQLAAALEEDYRDFSVLHGIALEQKESIERGDLAALDRTLVQARQLMEQIRQRQGRFADREAALRCYGPQLGPQCQRLRRLIARIEETRRANVKSLTDLRQRTRKQLAQFGGARKQPKGYGRASAGQARFVDGIR